VFVSKAERAESVAPIEVPDWWRRLCLKSYGGASRIKLYTRLARILRQPKANIVKVLEDLYQRAHRRSSLSRWDAEAVALSTMVSALKAGRKPSAALDGIAQSVELMLIKGGEEAGGDEGSAEERRTGLQRAFEQCVALDANRRRTTKAVRSAYMKLTLYLLMTIASLMVFSDFVVPQISLAFPPEHWQGFAASLYSVSTVVAKPQFTVVLSLVMLGLVAMPFTFPYWTGRLRDALDQIPPFSFYRLQQGGGWLMSIPALTQSGRMKAYDAVNVTASVAQPWLREHIHRIGNNMRGGGQFGRSLVASGSFPDKEVVEDIRLYEKQGLDVDEILATISREWAETGVERIERQASLMQMVTLSLFSAVIIWFTLGTVLLQIQMPAYFMSLMGG
jgi:type II secretory pathway component PulF